MCRALGRSAITSLIAFLGCGGGLEQAADEDGGASSSGAADGGASTLPPSSATGASLTSSATMDGSGGSDDPSSPTTDDPTASPTTGDPTDASESTASGDDGESSDGPSTTTGVGDCADQDEESTYPLIVSGSTMDAADDFTPGCGANQGADVAIRWTAPAGGTYLVDTIGSSFDTILSVWSDCDGSEIICDDDISGSDLDSALAVELDAGQTILIVVDGVNASGDFELHVTWHAYGNCFALPPGVACNADEACFSNASIGVCGVFDCESVAECPDPPPDGTAPVVCRDIGGTPSIDDCGLDCSGGETCPTGMSCLGNGICYW